MLLCLADFQGADDAIDVFFWYQRVVELESADVVGRDVCSRQGLGDLRHDATLIWGEQGTRSASRWRHHPGRPPGFSAFPLLLPERLYCTHRLPREFLFLLLPCRLRAKAPLSRNLLIPWASSNELSTLTAPPSSNCGHCLPVSVLCSPTSSSLPSFKFSKIELGQHGQWGTWTQALSSVTDSFLAR